MDESPTPPKPGAAKPLPYFIIAGVVMHESQWHGIANEFKVLCSKKQYSIKGEIKWRYFGAQNKEPHNTVAHLGQKERDSFRNEFFDIITKRKSVKVIACVASVAAAYATGYVGDEEALYHYTYKPVSERFQYHLQDLSRLVGDKQLGLVVADHRGRKQDDDFRLGHAGLVEKESPYLSTYENFVECIMLTPSHLSIGVQFADMVAGAISRYFNQGDGTYYKVIEPSFRSSPRGQIDGYGLIKFPKNSWK